MSTSQATTAPGWYGAFELKRSYQRNMALGVMYATLFHLAIIGGMLLYQYIKARGDDLSGVGVVVIKSISDGRRIRDGAISFNPQSEI